MIRGTVQSRRASIILPVFGENGLETEIEFVLDTGFTGMTTLPLSVCLSLGLPFMRIQHAGLADGSPVLLRVYAASLFWDDQERVVEALAMEGEPLIGMTLLDGFDLFLRAKNGGFLTIEPSQEED